MDNDDLQQGDLFNTPEETTKALKESAADAPAIETSDDGDGPIDNINPINIDDEMKSSYLEYAMSVIVGRALPDVRDWFNQFTDEYFIQCMNLVIHHQSCTKEKCGDVLGRYHPHGDTAVYDSLVRMAKTSQ